MNANVIRPSLLVKTMYSLGQAGWNLVNSCIMLLLIYFYAPPEVSEQAAIPEFIERKTIFLSFTVVGLLMFVGTVVSAFADIIMGPASDRALFKFGRRRTFLLIAFIPIALFTVMAFMPPIAGKSIWNAVWLGVSIIGFNIFLSMYVTPYNGLIAEIGHTQKDRVFISTIIAVTWGIGLIVAYSIFALKGVVAEQFAIPEAKAFQYIILVFSIIAAALMVLPVIFINEDKHCLKSEPVHESPFQQMKVVLKIDNFRQYMLVELFYWFSIQFLQLGIVYYITTLFVLEEHYATYAVVGFAVFSFLSFPLVLPLTEKYDKKILMLTAFLMQVVLFLFIAIQGKFQLPLVLTAIIIIILNSFPMAIFGILPMALVSDMATEDAENTGKFRSATFFGVKFFVMKIGLSLTSLLFPTLLLLGNSIDNNLGVRMTAFVGLIGSVIAMVLMFKVRMPQLAESELLEENA